MIIDDQKPKNKFIEKIKAISKTKFYKFMVRLVFFSGLAYWIYNPINIESSELVELKITTVGNWKPNGRRNPIRLYFKSKEYKCSFGIFAGGTDGRMPELKNALKNDNSNTIKIHSSFFSDLNTEDEVIPVYYLNNSVDGLIFDEYSFNDSEQNISNNYLIFYIFFFLFSLLGIKDKK